MLVTIFCEQAAYFVSHGFRRKDKRTNMMLVSLALLYFSLFWYYTHVFHQIYRQIGKRKEVLIEKILVKKSSWVKLLTQASPVLTDQ